MRKAEVQRGKYDVQGHTQEFVGAKLTIKLRISYSQGPALTNKPAASLDGTKEGGHRSKREKQPPRTTSTGLTLNESPAAAPGAKRRPRPRVQGASPSGGDQQGLAGRAWGCERCPLPGSLFWAGIGQAYDREASGREAPARAPLGSRTESRATRSARDPGRGGSRAGRDPSPRPSPLRPSRRRAPRRCPSAHGNTERRAGKPEPTPQLGGRAAGPLREFPGSSCPSGDAGSSAPRAVPTPPPAPSPTSPRPCLPAPPPPRAPLQAVSGRRPLPRPGHGRHSPKPPRLRAPGSAGSLHEAPAAPSFPAPASSSSLRPAALPSAAADARPGLGARGRAGGRAWGRLVPPLGRRLLRRRRLPSSGLCCNVCEADLGRRAPHSALVARPHRAPPSAAESAAAESLPSPPHAIQLFSQVS
ncbi:mucin-1-like [Heterocephalus glaber]|uniref:Mucin-1-like n=1 Tax=Heterocephalus glaber TaxID=10181 RepID=A0AAX6P319_HETGA|nr:mucin-1-like [Heterocephalus glaber]